MASLERLREVGRIATEHFQWQERQRRPGTPEENYFRFYEHGLTLWIHPVKVWITPQLKKIRQVRPFDRYGDPPATHGADFYFYQRLLKFFELDLAHWVGWSRDWITRDVIWHPSRHDAAHTASRLRWHLQIESNGQIEVKAYQDSHMGPGRTNGSRCSIETHNYQSLSPREQLWWRYVTWRLRGWLVDQYFKDRSTLQFDDPEEAIEARVRDSWHFKGEDTIYTPRLDMQPYNNRDYDGKVITNGDVKAFVKGGRMVIGKVFHNINNMWWAVAGEKVWNLGSSQLRDWRPEFSTRGNRHRRWFSAEARLAKLTRAKAQFVKDEHFERAAAVRDQIRKLELSTFKPKPTKAAPQESAL